MMLKHQGPSIKLCWESFQRQQCAGASDCGVFAIAAATALCFGLDPSSCQWDQGTMRAHLATCIRKGIMSPFPSVRRRRKGLNTRLIKLYEIYCLCRMSFFAHECSLAMCSMCKEWYHKECDNFPDEVFSLENTIYVCDKCQLTLK